MDEGENEQVTPAGRLEQEREIDSCKELVTVTLAVPDWPHWSTRAAGVAPIVAVCCPPEPDPPDPEPPEPDPPEPEPPEPEPPEPDPPEPEPPEPNPFPHWAV
jgi:hypothetical protein